MFLIGLAVLAAGVGSAWAQSGSEFRRGEWVETVPPAEGTAEGELALVRWQYEQGKLRSTVRSAKRYLKHYHDPAGREEVMLLAGEAEVKRGRLFQGYEWLEKAKTYVPKVIVNTKVASTAGHRIPDG